MRIAAIAALAMFVACSPVAGDCFPSTCGGCCSADGECLSGAMTTACGVGANACVDCSGAGLACSAGVCRGSVGEGGDAGMDAGVDAGAADAGEMGSMVFVTLRYAVGTHPMNCPADPLATTTPCVVAKQMTKTHFDAIRLNYAAACVTTQPTSDSYEIDCGGCAKKSEICLWEPDGGSPTQVQRDFYECVTPAAASADSCGWTP